mmetsp:Transcript_2715/g.4179  ORF Transcript_2715/g.4179 Transcript_2715/m.4179 type:complete len:139 (-) Transcript_2715:40-456(-)
MLAATLPTSSSDITRPTKISIAKTAQKHYSESKLMASIPSGKGEVGVFKRHSSAKNDHFLDPNFPFWGDANRFEKDNRGRVNLWTTLSHDRVADALLVEHSPGRPPSPGNLSLPSPFRKDQLDKQISDKKNTKNSVRI